jgi:flagellar biosynthetic protein FliP
VTTAHTTRSTVRAALTNRGFIAHYLQMLAAMGAGMLVLGPLAMLVGDASVVVDALLMATCMTAGMTAWMVWRRHPWRSIGEMGLAMYLSFAAPFPAYWLGALSGGGLMLVGRVLMLPAMALAMLHRREHYLCA